MVSQKVKSRPAVWDTLLLIPVAMLAALFAYDLDMALHATECASYRELGTGCLPLGWEGPFSDYWSNRSHANAIINATLNLGLGLAVLVACATLLFRPRSAPMRQTQIVLFQIGLIVVLIFKSLLLNTPS